MAPRRKVILSQEFESSNGMEGNRGGDSSTSGAQTGPFLNVSYRVVFGLREAFQISTNVDILFTTVEKYLGVFYPRGISVYVKTFKAGFRLPVPPLV